MVGKANEKQTASFGDAAEAIEKADAIVILAGAGMSVDSGLPDYRGDEGLWRAYPKLKELELSFEQIATPGIFEDNPELAWEFYGHRRKLYLEKKPHLGYDLVKKWGNAMPQGYFVYTSNVDGHFHFASFPPDRIVECHGNVHRIQCSEPCNELVWQTSPRDEFPVHCCPECSKVARPNIMMFNDWDWLREGTVHKTEGFEAWLRMLQVDEAKVVLLEIGAGSTLPAVRRQTDELIVRLNAQLIRINTREPDVPSGAVSMSMSALEALGGIDDALSESFKTRCVPAIEGEDEEPSQKSIKDRITAFLRASPDGVISTNPGNNLRNIKAGKVYARPCHLELSNGWTATVSRFEMDCVYSGQIEGIPDKAHVQKYVDRAKDHIRKSWHNPPIKVIEPKLFDAKSDFPIMPSLQLAAMINCGKARNDGDHGSWLALIWFAEIDDEKTIRDYVIEGLQSVDWERDAEGYCI